MQDETACRVFCEDDLQNSEAQTIDRRFFGRSKRRSERGCLRQDAVKVLASAVAVEKLVLFNELQAVSAACVDVGCQCRRIVEDLARSLEDVGNRTNLGAEQVER